MKGLFDSIDSLDDSSAGAVQVAPIQQEQKSIFDNAVLLSLELRVFGTSRKLDNSEYDVDASKEKTRASKGILKSKELKAIAQFDADSRNIVHRSYQNQQLFFLGIPL